LGLGGGGVGGGGKQGGGMRGRLCIWIEQMMPMMMMMGEERTGRSTVMPIVLC
jgi:hypothetical protein